MNSPRPFSRPIGRIHQIAKKVVGLVAVAGAVVLLGACGDRGNFDTGVIVEREPCSNNTGPWTGYNDFKVRNEDGTLTVYRCHHQLAVSDETPCPAVGDPMCKSNWDAIKIGASSSEVNRVLGDPVKVTGIRWKYPNNNSVSVDNGQVTNIFQHSAALYTAPPL